MATKTLNGTKVNTEVCRFEVRETHSSELAERMGKRADMVRVMLFTEAYREDGSTYPFLFCVYDAKKSKANEKMLKAVLSSEFAAFAA